MSFKNYLNKVIDRVKDYNEPENVKDRLKHNIEISKLRLEYEELERKRKEEKYKKWELGSIKFGGENGREH